MNYGIGSLERLPRLLQRRLPPSFGKAEDTGDFVPNGVVGMVGAFPVFGESYSEARFLVGKAFAAAGPAVSKDTSVISLRAAEDISQAEFRPVL